MIALKFTKALAFSVVEAETARPSRTFRRDGSRSVGQCSLDVRSCEE